MEDFQRATTNQGAEPSIDFSMLNDLRELESVDPGLLTTLIETFLRETPRQLEAITRAVRANDAMNVATLGHSLKGSAGALGARRLSNLCDQLQELGRSGILTGADDVLLGAEDEFWQVQREFEAHLENLDNCVENPPYEGCTGK